MPVPLTAKPVGQAKSAPRYSYYCLVCLLTPGVVSEEYRWRLLPLLESLRLGTPHLVESVLRLRQFWA